MKIKILQLTLLLAAISLAGGCAGDSESSSNNGSPTSQAKAIETTAEIPVPDTLPTAPTAVLTLVDSGSGSAANTPTPHSSDGSANATPVATLPADSDPDVTGLTAFCSLDQGAAKIACHASGAPDGFESQLKWGSNISGWTSGPSYEVFITEWVSAVIVTLE